MANIAKLDVVLTAGCNLRCSYCYQTDKKERRMAWDTLRAAADLVLQSERDTVSLLFIGGEPLLEFPLIRRAVEYVDARRRPGQRIEYQIVTNGTLLGDEQVQFFADHAFDLQLSFDGVPAAQQFRGAGTFVVLDRLIDRMRTGWPAFFDSVSVSITLIVPALEHLADSIDYFLAKRVREIAISPAATHQPGWRSEMIADLDRQFSRIFASATAHYERTGERPLTLFRGEDAPSVHKPEGRSMCGVGRGETPAVDVDGQVHGCLMFADSYQTFPAEFLRSRVEAMRMGPLSSPDLPARMAAYPSAVRATGLFHDKQLKFSSYGRCGDCRYLSTCGVCPVSIGHQPGNTDPRRVPDFLCAYNLVSLKYRDRFPKDPDIREILTAGPRIPSLMAPLRAFMDGA